ncbi:hypothetical protein [Streptomyces sp. NPDC054854]
MGGDGGGHVGDDAGVFAEEAVDGDGAAHLRRVEGRFLADAGRAAQDGPGAFDRLEAGQDQGGVTVLHPGVEILDDGGKPGPQLGGAAVHPTSQGRPEQVAGQVALAGAVCCEGVVDEGAGEGRFVVGP